ncbi:hypothetical protein NQ317_012488 [Molorchus minor]|uniref:Uncharacterized protein n=1 Tax=Molorchus minor TaxID=1323400 RepID=A0ABQ9K4H2_9CUCU|nr:hypothetical protein NQ317_012488 [Molorchus minor]
MGNEEKNQPIKDGIIDFVAGSVGGVALVYVGQPLDTVKVKMQTFPHLYKNMIDCFKKTLKNDGLYRGLYAGTAPALATKRCRKFSSIPVLRFLSKNNTESHRQRKRGKFKPYE